MAQYIDNFSRYGLLESYFRNTLRLYEKLNQDMGQSQRELIDFCLKENPKIDNKG
ncbi:MAG: hypothetical protein NTW32_27100 [Chloroflexi bacterium]|nr:hypothetical protein [Chloroflexota bacterium]